MLCRATSLYSRWQKQGIDLLCFSCAATFLQMGGGVGQMATLWSMLRDMHTQCPLDGTSKTRPVLLGLLKDGLDGAVSITVLTRKNER